MKNYNQRQLESILTQLAAYESGRINLAGLISSLESLLNALQSMPESWLEEIRRQWGIIEEVYSVSVVREQPIDAPENQLLVDQAIIKMRALINTVL